MRLVSNFFRDKKDLNGDVNDPLTKTVIMLDLSDHFMSLSPSITGLQDCATLVPQ